MSRTYKVTATVTLVVLVVSTICAIIGVPNGPALALLLFLLPLIWILWIVSAIVEAGRSIWKLGLLWGLIDFTVLVVLNLIVSNAKNAIGPGGEEDAFVIAFSPLVWPMILMSRYLPYDFGSVISSVVASVPGIGNVLSDWLGFSMMAAIPSLLVIGLCRLRWARK